MQINFENMIDKNFNSNVLNKGNQIFSNASATAVNHNKRQSKNSIRKTKSHAITPTTKNVAEQREKKERSCNIIIHGRKKSMEQSGDTLFINNMIQEVCGNVATKLISRTGRSVDNKEKPIKVILPNE